MKAKTPKDIIEINDRKYDASTGRPLGGARGHEAPKKQKTINKAGGKIRTASRKPQKSKTLMRPGVKKPAHKAEAKAAEESAPALSLPQDKERARRAKHVPKSKKITRFNFSIKSKTVPTKHVQNMEVRQPPVHKPAPKPAANTWPVIDQFEKAMQEATSHLETFVGDTKHAKKSRKFAYAAISLIVLGLIGFGSYSAIPIAKVKLAGDKAGFPASLPNYSPAGFGLADPVESNYGEVTLSYKSKTDDKGFKIIQSPSRWNSESLVNNFLLASGKQYRAVTADGQTIYTYDDSDATWVDGGIWFKVEGNAELNEDQLINLARGL